MYTRFLFVSGEREVTPIEDRRHRSPQKLFKMSYVE